VNALDALVPLWPTFYNVLINGGIYTGIEYFIEQGWKVAFDVRICSMAMIMEQAGGAGQPATGAFLMWCRRNPQRVLHFLGSIDNVFELDQFYKWW
jgi:fructose-1,6-bisphosphatase